MILATAVALFALQAPSAKDFMPLVPGTRWTYLETGEDSLTYVYTAEASKTFGGKTATPIVVRYKGNPLSTTFYVVEDDSVGIVSEDGSSPYNPPRPLFKISTDPQTWTYTGDVPFNDATAPITLSGSSHLGEKRTVLGKEVETLMVSIDATLTPPKGKPMTQHQDAVYAKGFGLVEMSMTGTVNGETHKQHLELTKLQLPEKSGG